MIVVSLLASSTDYTLPLAVLILSAVSLAYGIFGSGRWNRMSTFEQAQSDRIEDLVRQVEKLREDNKDCARRCRDLEQENITMLRKLARMENGHK